MLDMRGRVARSLASSNWRFQPEKTFHLGSKEPMNHELVDIRRQIKERPGETDEEKQRSQEPAGNA
jgi:hypothetical protein